MDESLYLPSEEKEQGHQKPKPPRTRNKDENRRSTTPSSPSLRGMSSVFVQVLVFTVTCLMITQKTLLRSASQSSRGLSSLEEQDSYLPKTMETDLSQQAFSEHLPESSPTLKHMKHVDYPQQIETESKASRHTPNIIVQNKKVKTKTHSPTRIVEERDSECIFRGSALYRSIYVYPSPSDKEWEGEILSKYARAAGQNISWPWLEMDQRLKQEGKAQYDANNKDFNQYTTELLVRDIIEHPDSCLRTYDPESASLFYIPYLPSKYMVFASVCVYHTFV